MSVDIKSLRIGSHIKCGGDIHQIVELNIIDAPSPLIRGMLCDKDFSVFSYPKTLNIDFIEPIKITPELLAELGFLKGDIGGWFKPMPDFMIMIHGHFDGKWFVKMFPIGDGHHDTSEVAVKYLHELEFFYYHVFKKELIEE